MTDLDLLTFGCAVFFITIAGVYVALRGRFGSGPSEARAGMGGGSQGNAS